MDRLQSVRQGEMLGRFVPHRQQLVGQAALVCAAAGAAGHSHVQLVAQLGIAHWLCWYTLGVLHSYTQADVRTRIVSALPPAHKQCALAPSRRRFDNQGSHNQEY